MGLTIRSENCTPPILDGSGFNPEKPADFADGLDQLLRFKAILRDTSPVITPDLPTQLDDLSISSHFETWYCAIIAHCHATLSRDVNTIKRLNNHYSVNDFAKVIDQGEEFFPEFPHAAKYMFQLLGGEDVNQDHLNSGLNFIGELNLEPLNYGIGDSRLRRAFSLLVPHESGRLKITDAISRNFASTLMFETMLSKLGRKKGWSISRRLEDIALGLNRDIPYRHSGLRTEKIYIGNYEAVDPHLLDYSMSLMDQQLPGVDSSKLLAFVLGNLFHLQPSKHGNKRSSIALGVSLLAQRSEYKKVPHESILVPNLMHGMDHKLSNIHTRIITEGPRDELISEALVDDLTSHLNSLEQVPLGKYCDSIAKDGLTKLK